MQDVRYAIRRLRATPGFTTVAVVVLALGIGANTAVFSLIDALYFKTLPATESARLVHLYTHRPGRSFQAGFSDAEYASVRARTHALSSVAAQTSIAQLHIVVQDVIREVRGEFVSAGYFPTLNATTSHGRFFVAAEDEVAGRNPVAVLGARLCRELFGSQERCVGAGLRVNGNDVTVVGVASPGFIGDDVSRGADIWLPQAMLGPAGYGCVAGAECNSIDVLVARLMDGQTVRTAQADAAATIVWSPALDEHRAVRRELVVAAIAGADPDTRDRLRPQMQLLAALTGALLIIACANLAGLLVARALMRRREIAIRLSIGATRLRVIKQLLTEGLLLSAVGGGAGLLVSRWAVAMLAGFYNVDSEGFLHSYDFEPDVRVYLYVCVVAAVTGMAAALAPALQSSRDELVVALKDARGSDGSPCGSRLRHSLVIGQVALSLVLIVSSSLLVRSAMTITRGTHFDPSRVAVLRIRPELARFSDARAEAFARDASARLRRVPGVESVGMMIGGEGLVWEWGSGRSLSVSRPGAAPLTVVTQDVDEEFFSTLRIPIRSGRVFSGTDRHDAFRVAVANEALARALWPEGDVVGRTALVDDVPYRIVGTVADIQPLNAAASPAPHLYRAFWQTSADAKGDVRFAVRVVGLPEATLPALRAAIRELDPAVPLGEDMTMAQQVMLHYAPVLLARRVTVWCGVIAVVLSAMGLYSVLALTMRSRTREIGIRIAIGARPDLIARQFLSQALALGAAGIGVGTGAAWAATRLIGSWLYGVDAHDAASYAGATVVVVAAVLAAGYLPARRAAQVDPLSALRVE